MSEAHQEPTNSNQFLNFQRPFMVRKLSEKLKTHKTAPLIVISGPSGSGKTCLIEQGVFGPIDSATFASVAYTDLINKTVAVALCDQIIDKHPSFKSRRSSSVFREKMTRCVETDPKEAAAKLRHMMQEVEGEEDFSKERIKLIICLDEFDEFIKGYLKEGGEIHNLVAPFHFLKGMLGMKSLLFAVTHRNWVTAEVDSILSEIEKEQQLKWQLDFPKGQELNSMVKTAINPYREKWGGKYTKDFDKLSKYLINQIKSNPATFVFLKAYLKELLASKENLKSKVSKASKGDHYVSYISDKCEANYASLPFDQKLSQQEVVTKLAEEDLSFIKAMHVEDLDNAISRMVRDRFLYIDSSQQSVQISPTHKLLLEKWERAVDWVNNDELVGLPEIRNFNEKALAWEVADRNKDLLLTDEDKKATAQKLLEDQDFISQLTPQTVKFLTASTAEPRDYRKLLRKGLWPLVGLIVVSAIGIPLIKPGESSADVKTDEKVEQVVSGGSEENVEAIGVLSQTELVNSLETAEESIGLSLDSGWNDIITKMQRDVANGESSAALDGLSWFHAKSVSEPETISRINPAQFEQFTSTLSEIATAQDDRLATQAVWKYEFDETEEIEFCTKLRLIMARLAMNDGRKLEAVAYIENAPVSETANPYSTDFVESALEWHFSKQENLQEVSSGSTTKRASTLN